MENKREIAPTIAHNDKVHKSIYEWVQKNVKINPEPEPHPLIVQRMIYKGTSLEENKKGLKYREFVFEYISEKIYCQYCETFHDVTNRKPHSVRSVLVDDVPFEGEPAKLRIQFKRYSCKASSKVIQPRKILQVNGRRTNRLISLYAYLNRLLKGNIYQTEQYAKEFAPISDTALKNIL